MLSEDALDERLELRQTWSRSTNRFRFCEDLVTEALAQSLRGEQVHCSAKCLGERLLDLDELEQADGGVGREVNQHVDVAVVPGGTVNVRTEQGNRLDVGAVWAALDGASQSCCEFFFHHECSIAFAGTSCQSEFIV